MNNGRPISQRKAVQLMVLLTLLAWATQTLFHQWGYGQELPAADDRRAPADDRRASHEPDDRPTLPEPGAERFVPAPTGTSRRRTARWCCGPTRRCRRGT